MGRPVLLLPLEPCHLFHTATAEQGNHDGNIDQYGDSYARDIDVDSLRALMDQMPPNISSGLESSEVLNQMHCDSLDAMRGLMFHGCIAHFREVPMATVRLFEFASGQVTQSIQKATHVLEGVEVKDIRKDLSSKRQLPRIVKASWVTESFSEGTRLDEERRSLVSCGLGLS